MNPNGGDTGMADRGDDVNGPTKDDVDRCSQTHPDTGQYCIRKAGHGGFCGTRPIGPLPEELDEILTSLRRVNTLDPERIEKLERLADVARELVRVWEDVEDDIMLYNRLNRLREALSQLEDDDG